MHIPDGFIPIAQCLIYYVILIVALYFSVKWAKSNLDEKRIPLLAVLAALACAIEMSIAGTFPINIGIPSMVLYHLFIGIIEAVLTVVVVAALDKFRPDLLAWNKN